MQLNNGTAALLRSTNKIKPPNFRRALEVDEYNYLGITTAQTYLKLGMVESL